MPTIREVAKHIHRLTELDTNIKYVPVPDEGERGRKSDNATFNALYSHLPPALSIEEGLNRYISWALDHEEWWRETADRTLQKSALALASA